MMSLKDTDIQRAGIIPYVKKKGKVFFLFGLGEGIASISDFGGTRELSDADVLETALREFHEETFNVIGTLTRDNLKHAPYIIGETGFHETEKCALFFVAYRQDFPFFAKMNEFKERNVPGDETRGLIVLEREQLFRALKQPEKRIQSSKVFLFHAKVRSVLLLGKDTIGSL
uniref:NUDIX hydrolase n=1 Tax=Pithovirus LCPAC304 TaxID=2506594 RepID=A0A481Z8U8_9VIRU|nr:MAG: hypothetical protein LCPAC304_02560 [Pithovirus LCPAC304]